MSDRFKVYLIVMVVLSSILGIVYLAVTAAVRVGRIDIASGRVTATLETQADGTTKWAFGEEEK